MSISLGLSSTPAQKKQADHPVVAVADFASRLPTHTSQMQAAALGDQVLSVLAKIPDLPLVERRAWEAIGHEHALFTPGTLSDSLATGRWEGADWILLGELGRNRDNQLRLSLELVDVRHADVLAATAIAASELPETFGEVTFSALEKAVQRLVVKARQTQKRNATAQVVLAPMFFEFSGRLRNLEFLRYRFFTLIQEQLSGRSDIRILRFPRVSASQEELEMRVFGWTSSTPQEDGPPVVFLWGDFAEKEAEGKAPEAVPLRATVWLQGKNGTRKLDAEAIRSEFEEMLGTLVQEAVQTAWNLTDSNHEPSYPNEELVGELRRQAGDLMAEHSIRLRESTAKDESLIRLAMHIKALYEVVCFLSPEDGELRREALVSRSALVFHHASRSLAPNQEMNQLWRRFEESFPSSQNGKTVFTASQTALLLLDGRTFLDRPRDEPQVRSRVARLAMQRDILERMQRMGPELLLADTHTGQLVAYQRAFDDAEMRARFVEMLWPVFLAHSKKVNNLAEQRARWAEILPDIFAAVGRPQRAVELLALASEPWPEREQKEEPHRPEDQRFLVRRLDILPPILPVQPRKIALGERNYGITALRFDGTHLWIGAEEKIRQQTVSRSVFRYAPEERNPQCFSSPLPSPISSIAVGGGSLWFATERQGIFQADSKTGAIVQNWNVDSGLPTNHVRDVTWCGDALLAGGGERHRGHFFALRPGENGVVNLPVFGWSEDLAGWRQHEKEKSQHGEVSLLLREHGGTLVVAGGNQPLLWQEGADTGLNLRRVTLDGPARYGSDAHAGRVLCAAADAEGWWLGTTAGLARFSPDGTLLQRWSPGRGPYFFQQKHWVPHFRQNGQMRAFFSTNTRLVGAVTALAADGDLLFLATSTEQDEYLASPLEDAHLYILHIPSARWVGRVPLPGSVTAMTQDDDLLWIGLKNQAEPLLEFAKKDFARTPPENYVSDQPAKEEIAKALAALTPREQACYAFFWGDYHRVAELLRGKQPSEADLGELFLMAFAHDQHGLNQPEISHRYFTEILARDPYSFWADEAQRGLAALEIAP